MSKGNSRNVSQAQEQKYDSFVLGSPEKNFIIDLDGCISKLISPSLTSGAVIRAEEVPGAKDWVDKIQRQGHKICFFSSRPERLRRATEEWLSLHGFKYDSLIFSKPLAKSFHYIDDRHVRATTFRGKYSKFVRKQHRIQVFG